MFVYCQIIILLLADEMDVLKGLALCIKNRNEVTITHPHIITHIAQQIARTGFLVKLQMS